MQNFTAKDTPDRYIRKKTVILSNILTWRSSGIFVVENIMKQKINFLENL